QNQSDLNSTPWEITIHENGNIRVFGITLGKTTIQDASQILASFPETRLIMDAPQARLVAVYDELNIGGFIASIELNYAVESDTLKELLKNTVILSDKNYGLLDKTIEIELLSTVINGLLYRPSINYDVDIILQRFGPPASEVKLTDTITRMEYPDIGLQIIIDTQGPDQFKYQTLRKPSPSDTTPAEIQSTH
ncbi:MAG: hypothetical protein OQL09_04615, partial [Gammaproteobacteria bacterium]|nr:hypothetical protein [Gammaproteobacteria bacterium]